MKRNVQRQIEIGRKLVRANDRKDLNLWELRELYDRIGEKEIMEVIGEAFYMGAAVGHSIE